MKCTNCKKREGVVEYCEGMLAYSHGFVEKLCRQCLIKRLEKNIESCKKQIKKQKELLNE